jgi:competence protein ComEA
MASVASLPPVQRNAYYALGILALAWFAYAGGERLQSPPKIKVEQVGQSEPPQALSKQSLVGTSTATQTEIVVDVIGAVSKPGVYRFSPGKRVVDALHAAGPLPSADVYAFNRAAPLVDGTQIQVPVRSSVAQRLPRHRGSSGSRTNPRPQALVGSIPVQVEIPESYRPSANAQYSARPQKSAEHAGTTAGIVALNTASAAELDTLPGVGPATAEKIIAYRQQHGGFSSVDELLAVQGIGPKKLEALRPRVRL